MNESCPICDGAIPNEKDEGKYPGALSRYDNKTEICSNCGLIEAMFEFQIGDYRSENNQKTYSWKEWKDIMISDGVRENEL